MSMIELKDAIKLCKELYGKDATIKALNTMYHDGKVTQAQVLAILDYLN